PDERLAHRVAQRRKLGELAGAVVARCLVGRVSSRRARGGQPLRDRHCEIGIGLLGRARGAQRDHGDGRGLHVHPHGVNRVTRVSALASTVKLPGQTTSSMAYGGETCETPRSASCMIDTCGCTPSTQAYESSPCATVGTVGSGSAIPVLVGAYM